MTRGSATYATALDPRTDRLEPRTTTPAAAHALGPCLKQLYGDAAQYMIKTSTGQKIGLWQDPSQFAAAMAYHGTLTMAIPTRVCDRRIEAVALTLTLP